MFRFLADENFESDVVSALLSKPKPVDIVRVQDVGLRTRDDPTILNWAAMRARILLIHDQKTIPHYAYERVRQGQPMPGILVVGRQLGIGAMIDAIILAAECSLEGEWEGQVRYLPL